MPDQQRPLIRARAAARRRAPAWLVGAEQWRLKRALARTFGRPVHCHRCGGYLFHCLPFVWHQNVMLLGAASEWVYVEWASPSSLRFRHLEREKCI